MRLGCGLGTVLALVLWAAPAGAVVSGGRGDLIAYVQSDPLDPPASPLPEGIYRVTPDPANASDATFSLIRAMSNGGDFENLLHVPTGLKLPSGVAPGSAIDPTARHRITGGPGQPFAVENLADGTVLRTLDATPQQSSAGAIAFSEDGDSVIFVKKGNALPQVDELKLTTLDLATGTEQSLTLSLPDDYPFDRGDLQFSLPAHAVGGRILLAISDTQSRVRPALYRVDVQTGQALALNDRAQAAAERVDNSGGNSDHVTGRVAVDVRGDGLEAIVLEGDGESWFCPASTDCVPGGGVADCPSGMFRSSVSETRQSRGCTSTTDGHKTIRFASPLVATAPSDWMRLTPGPDVQDGPAEDTLAFSGFIAAGYTPDGEVFGDRADPDPDQTARFDNYLSKLTFHVLRRVEVYGEGVVIRPPAGHRIQPLVWTATPGAEVTVLQGPPAVSGRDLDVTFAAPEGAGAGALQCSLDGADFATCTSPLALRSLPLGPHTLKLRFVAQGGAPGAEKTLTWEVKDLPVVSITSQPKPEVDTGDAEVAFTSDFPAEEVFAYTCTVDGAAPAICTSPLKLTGLAPGPHRVEVTVETTDDRVSAPAVATWRRKDPPDIPPGSNPGPGTPPAPGQPPSGTGQPPLAPIIPLSPVCATNTPATFSAGAIVAALESSCFTLSNTAEGLTATTAQTVKVNGIELTPTAGGKVEIARQGQAARVRWTTPVHVRIGLMEFDMPARSWSVPVSSNGIATVNKALPELGKAALKKIGLESSPVDIPTLSFSNANGGQTELSLSIAFPEFFTSVPGIPAAQDNAAGSAASVSFAIKPRVSNTDGFALNASVAVSEAYLFGKLKLKKLTLGIDTGQRSVSFSGAAVLGDPFSPKAAPELSVSFQIGPGGLLGVGQDQVGLKDFQVLAAKLNRPLAYGFFLQRLGASLTATSPTVASIGGTAGISFGPRVKVGSVFDGEAFSLDGKVGYRLPRSSTAAGAGFDLSGTAKAVELLELAAFSVGVDFFPAKLTMSARLSVPVPVLAFLNVDGHLTEGVLDYEGRSILLRGSASLNVLQFFTLANADALVTQTGWGICGVSVGGHRVGVGAAWTTPAAQIHPIVEGCDLERMTSGGTRQAGRPSGEVTVAAGQKLLAIEATGATGAVPSVTLVGPKGERFPSQAPGPGRAVVPNPGRGSVVFLVDRPSAGAWHFEGEALMEIRASKDAPMKVSAKVNGREVRWSADVPGDARIDFAETSSGASVPVRTVRGRGGRFTFTPAAVGLQRRRALVATIVRNGVPVRSVAVARYTVAPAKLGRPGSVRLSRDRRTVSWKAARGAARYAVSVSANGTQLLATTLTRRTQIRLRRAVPKRTTATVSIVAIAASAATPTRRTARLHP